MRIADHPMLKLKLPLFPLGNHSDKPASKNFQQFQKLHHSMSPNFVTLQGKVETYAKNGQTLETSYAGLVTIATSHNRRIVYTES